jgi:hypothetical protein
MAAEILRFNPADGNRAGYGDGSVMDSAAVLVPCGVSDVGRWALSWIDAQSEEQRSRVYDHYWVEMEKARLGAWRAQMMRWSGAGCRRLVVEEGEGKRR